MTAPSATFDTADVLVIGAGAAGAAFCWRMAGHSLNVVCLEQGDWVDPAGSPNQSEDWELALQTRFHPNPNIRNATADYPVDASDSEIQPANYNAVGGSTIRWGAHFPRLHPSDFRTASLDGVGVDWPIGYTDLEPYYHINDRMMGISGLAGDPANPPRPQREFPPLPLCGGTRRLPAAFDRLGWHWWPSDAAINSRSTDLRQSCNNCGPCGLGCPRRARASADITYWPAATSTGVSVKTGCTVLAINASPSGSSVESVDYVDRSGNRHTINAHTIVVAASGLGTPRLLLSSLQKDARLAGINESGQLGHNLMLHPTAIVTGVFKQDLNSYQGAFACALYSQEHYETHKSRGFVRGFQLQALRGQGPLGTALGGYMNRVPWGTEHHRQFVHTFNHAISLTVTSEDLPEFSNRVRLHSSRTDTRGLAIPRMHYHVSDNTQRILAFGIERARQVLQMAGATSININRLSRQAGFHFMGTARMGDDPSNSIVSADGKCHAVSNLMIIDGSVFPTAGAVNPTPTIQAYALRCADALLDRLIPKFSRRVHQHVG